MICKNCGAEIIEGFFCPECGTKFDNSLNDKDSSMDDVEEEILDYVDSLSEEEINEVLENASFYYSQSYEKGELHLKPEKQRYYNMAQKELRKAYKRCKNNYKIIWELSKPIDFNNPEDEKNIEPTYSFDEILFEKALELANISEKKDIISQHDNYINLKNEKMKKNKTEFYEKEEKKRIEAERKREQELQEQRAREAEEAYNKKIREEKEEVERKRQEEINTKIREQELQEKKEREELETKERAKQDKIKADLKKYRKSLSRNIVGWISVLTVFLPVFFALSSLSNLKDFNPEQLSGKIKSLKISNYVLVFIDVALIIYFFIDVFSL